MDVAMNATATTIPNDDTAFDLSCDGAQSISADELLKYTLNQNASFQAMMFLPFPLLGVIYMLFLDEVIFLIKHSVQWRRTSYLLWSLAGFPVLATLCVVMIFMPRTTYVSSFATSFFFAIVVKKFFMLVLNYYGGKRKMAAALKPEGVVTSNPFPCCFICCCCNQEMTVSRINKLHIAVYQVIFVFPIVYFITTLFAAERLTSRSAGIALTVIDWFTPLSSFTCLYAFVVVSKASRFTLQQFNIRAKFLCVQMVVAFNTVQGFTVRTVDRFGGLPCGYIYPDKEHANVFHCYMFFYELFFLAVCAWFAYKRNEEGAQVMTHEMPMETFTNFSTEVDVEIAKIPIEGISINNNDENRRSKDEKLNYELPQIYINS